ncbi:nicotinic acid mononucleotide adenylyltransferase [Klebsiella pneumoniae]|uniref:Nicotinate-nucleotide adenylyltransferase n=1 Tax=Klebsiella pneumoniae TaxID=573 RepID=A0A447S345_KLEPN|nr:nicotinic acid mononucleotide adenylyltransferase [Klebsiella pneumoniae]
MVDMTQLQAIYGGTFDPVHYGHLKPVEILANQIGLSKVIIMPNNVPPHRPQPEATSAQRMHMLKLAIADKPLFTLDERELRRDTPLLDGANAAGVAPGAGPAQTAGVVSLARIRY